MTTKNIELSDFPEEVTEEGLKIYGPTSYKMERLLIRKLQSSAFFF